MLLHRPVFGVFALLTTTLGLYLATFVRNHHAWYLYCTSTSTSRQPLLDNLAVCYELRSRECRLKTPQKRSVALFPARDQDEAY